MCSNPGTGGVIAQLPAHVPDCTQEEVDLAVAAGEKDSVRFVAQFNR